MSIESKIEELTGEVTNLTNAIHALIEAQGGDAPSDSSDAGTEGQNKPSGGSKKKSSKKKSSKKKASTKADNDDDNDDDGDDEPEVTLKEVQQKLMAVGKEHGRAGIEKILKQFGAPNAKSLDPDQYADVVAAADAKLEE